jgi:hypothetical protein
LCLGRAPCTKSQPNHHMGIPFPGQTSGLGQQPRPYLWRVANAWAFAIEPQTYQTTSKFKHFLTRF